MSRWLRLGLLLAMVACTRVHPADCIADPGICAPGERCDRMAGVCAADPADLLCSADRICWDNPRPTGSLRHGVFGQPDGTLWAVGELGLILRWQAGVWRAVPSGTRATLRSIWGPAGGPLFAVGDEGTILRWEQGRWSAEPSDAHVSLYAVHGGSGEVYAAGDLGTLLRRTPTGWSAVPGVPGVGLRRLAGDPAKELLALGERGTLLHLPPGGAVIREAVAVDARALTTRGDDTWLLTASELWYRRSPALAWSRTTGIDAVDLRPFSSGVLLIDEVGNAVCYPADLPIACPQPAGAGYDLRALWLDEDGAGAAVGRGAFGIGARFAAVASDQASPVEADLNGVWRSDDGSLWANGESLVLRGSRTWQPQGLWLGGIQLMGGQSGPGWLLGGTGLMTYTDRRWSRLRAFMNAPFSALWARDQRDIWLVGGAGATEHWDGQTWTVVPAPPRTLVAVWSNGEEGWAADQAGLLLRLSGARRSPTGTLDLRTAAWVGYDTPSAGAGAIHAFWGAEEGSLWAVGAFGTVLHYAQGAWTQDTTLTTTADLWAVHGRATNDVWVAGALGTLLRWDGQRWFALDSGTDLTLRGVWAAQDSTVWVVGEKGAVLTYQPPARP